MTTKRREFSATDANPTVLYAKTDPNDVYAYPVTADFFMKGMFIPRHDTEIVDESNANNVTITYQLNAVTVATKTIIKSGTTTTISMSYV